MILFVNFAKKMKMIDYLIVIFISASLAFACKSDKSGSFSHAVSNDLSDEMAIPTTDGKVDEKKMAKIEFEEKVFDFGKVKEGKIVEHNFKFKNTGTKDLLLLYHQTTCGCTVPEFSKEPYSPGKSGEIKIIFDTKGKKLSQTKKIKIFANTYPNMTELTIQVYVIPN
jgi:hypothetical protein